MRHGGGERRGRELEAQGTASGKALRVERTWCLGNVAAGLCAWNRDVDGDSELK